MHWHLLCCLEIQKADRKIRLGSHNIRRCLAWYSTTFVICKFLSFTHALLTYFFYSGLLNEWSCNPYIYDFPLLQELIKNEGKRILNFSYPFRMHTNAKVFQVVRGVQVNLKKMDDLDVKFSDDELIAIMDDYITNDASLRKEQV